MDSASNIFANSIFVTFILLVIFFLLGVGVGWFLRGRNSLLDFNSAWQAGHPHAETSIAPMLNPSAYSNAMFKTGRPTREDEEVFAPVEERALEAVEDSAQVESEAVDDSVPAEAGVDSTELPGAWRGLGGDVASGIARVDDSLGLVYSEAPDHADDLTALKGVAKVLNGKLNDFGVYTYRQIAGWNDSIVAEFSTRLSFKDRVQRDDWIGQAKALHKEKYGEDLD
jgi:hypothetical protein